MTHVNSTHLTRAPLLGVLAGRATIALFQAAPLSKRSGRERDLHDGAHNTLPTTALDNYSTELKQGELRGNAFDA